MRQAITAIAVIAVLFTATCGGQKRNEAPTSALTPLSPLVLPSKTASVIPADVRLVARDAGIALSAGGYTLSWEYENPGDYGQDGIVALEDIAPLSEHFNEAVTPANEWIDGSGNGKLGIEDVTPLAMNWDSEVTGYRLDGAEATEGPWSEVALVELVDGDASCGSRAFTNEIAPGYTYYRIVTITPEGDAASSEALVAPSNEPIIYGVSPTSGYQHEEYTFTATASGQEPLTYAWDFGGGATPNTSSEISPTVTLADAGEYSATLTISNSYGPTTFPFTLTVNARDMWVHTWKGLGSSSGSGSLLDDTSVYVAGSDNEDALLMKYSQDGNLLWAREYGVEGAEVLVGCVFDAASNLVACGQSFALGEGNTDLLLLKYSPAGDLLRAMTWGTGDYEYIGRNICSDSEGNLYLCGKWVVYGGESLALVVKLSSDWSILWAKLWGGTSSDRALGITAIDNAIYVCGDTESFGSSEGDAYILKMDEDGNVLWARTWGTERSDVFYSVVVGLDGSVYAVGKASIPSEPSTGIVARYSSEGAFLKAIGWESNAEVSCFFNDASIDDKGRLYVVGAHKGEGYLINLFDEELDFVEGMAWNTDRQREQFNTIAFDNHSNLYIVGSGATSAGSWSDSSDLSYIPVMTAQEIEGQVWSFEGVSNEAAGTSSVLEGLMDQESDNQLLIMKNYPT